MRTRTRRLRALLDDTPDWRGDVAIEAEAFTTATRTDALGRTVWTQLADGTIRREAFHPGGALATVQLTTPDGALVDAPIVSGLARDAHGRIAAATLGNGCVQAWRYDVESGQLAAQDAVHAGRALQALRYTYDPDGRLVRALDLAQEGPGALVPGAVTARRDYRYDAHGRLLEATGRVHQALLPHDGPATAGLIHGARHISLDNGAALERYTQRFQWDQAGNLARVQHIGATASWATDFWISPTSNRASPALDDNGNPIIAPETRYDAGGNLTRLWHLRTLGHSWRACLTHAVTVARAAGPVDDGERYANAADRVRVRKVATRLVVGGDAPVIESREVVYLDGGQERVRVRRGERLVLERFTTHVSDGDRRVAVVDRHVVDTLGHEVDAIGPARVRYHLTAAQGSTALELDEHARLISYEEYLPHGGSAFIAGDSVREVARRDIRYAGKERDRATGLHAYPQRYYAPWLGRWLTPDPLGPEDGLNLYAFVGGDPIGYVDPEGTDRENNDPPKAEWVWSFDDEGNPVTPYRWNGTAWEAWWGSEPLEVIEIEDSAPTPEQQAAYDKRLFGNPRELIGILHQVQEAQRHQQAANELAELAIEKWGYGKYRDYLGGFDFWAVTESVRPGEVATLLGNVENYLAAVGQAKEPSAFANASAGFGNGITFGLIGWANRKAGLDTNYSETSDAFRYGNYSGAAAGIVLTGGAGALEYGVARTATWVGVGAGTGFGIATLQTGADLLDGKDVTWGGYLEHAGISTLYGAYGGSAFGLAGPTARTALGIIGSGAQLGEGAYQLSNGNYARGTLDLGLGGLGGYLTLRLTPANRISERDLLKIEQPAKAIRYVRRDNESDGAEFLDDALRINEQPFAEPPVAAGAPPTPAKAAGGALGVGDDLIRYASGKDGLMASLGKDGILDLYIKAGPSTPRGGQMFAEAMEAFGANVKGVRGTWIGGGDLAANFNSYKAAIASGLSPAAAAASTFTGKMAARFGFSNVRVIADDAARVVVEFF